MPAMDPPKAAQTPGAAEAPVPPGTGSGEALAGYKIVKVRKADGTVATVKRKVSTSEGSTRATAQDVPADTSSASPSGETPKFKIVTVRKGDGTLVKVRRQVTKQTEVTVKENVAPEEAARERVESSQPVAGAASTLQQPGPTGISSVPVVNKSNPVDPSRTVANAESTVVKPTPTVIASVPADTKSNTPSANATEDPKGTSASAAVDASRSTSNDAAAEPKADQREHADALAEQAIYNRERRTHRFKSSLLKGFGMAVGAALPSLELSHDFEDGDEILSDDDDDYSVDDMDERDDHEDGGHDMSDELHARSEVDSGAAHEVGNGASGPHVTFDAGAALGGVAATAAANAAAQPPPPPPGAQAAARAAQNGGTTKSDPEKEKHTYKITAKELADIEQGTAEKVTEKKLSRHWANLTFYFMASLSVVLPSLFILLAGFIGGMNGKLVGSSWSKMENPIKIAVSAWPIVFAAVVAQCFKAYATFKVERGIKLMELEQLVGSSSFASAIKQPVLLRRLDLLTLALFAVWCLSPLGSQALLRVYGVDRRLVSTTSEVLLAPNYGHNRLFSPGNDKKLSDNPEYDELFQLVATYYIAALAPLTTTSKYVVDDYLHPVMFTSPKEGTEQPLSNISAVQAFGSYLIYPQPHITDDEGPSTGSSKNAESTLPKFEEIMFTVPFSYFTFSCEPWQNKTLEELDAAEDFIMMTSDSGTFGLSFTSPDNTTANYTGIRLASANGAVRQATGETGASATDKQPWSDPTYPFSYIECGFKQLFEEVMVTCETDTTTSTAYPYCYADYGQSTPLPAERTEGMATTIGDFSWDMAYANPATTRGSPATLAEFYLLTGIGGDTSSNNGLTMSKDVSVVDLEIRFGYLFNTFLGLGFCPECVNIAGAYSLETQTQEVKDLYKPIPAQVRYANDLVYVINGPWLAGFTVCAAILFLAGLAGVVVESMTVAPDVLGYVSTVARNSRYLQLPKTSSAMSGGERAKTVGGVKVMMQDVKGKANVGKIALGLKHENAQRLVAGRLYR